MAQYHVIAYPGVYRGLTGGLQRFTPINPVLLPCKNGAKTVLIDNVV